MKTATFSTGHTETYKGKRDVRAAYLLITPALSDRPTGRVIGFSADRDRALARARGAAREASPYLEKERTATYVARCHIEIADVKEH